MNAADWLAITAGILLGISLLEFILLIRKVDHADKLDSMNGDLEFQVRAGRTRVEWWQTRFDNVTQELTQVLARQRQSGLRPGCQVLVQFDPLTQRVMSSPLKHDYLVWSCADGRQIRVKDMDNQHLLNTERLVRGQGVRKWVGTEALRNFWLRRLRNEILIRGLKPLYGPAQPTVTWTYEPRPVSPLVDGIHMWRPSVSLRRQTMPPFRPRMWERPEPDKKAKKKKARK